MFAFDESVVEGAALDWLDGLRWTVKNGPETAPDGSTAEGKDFGQVVLEPS